jgi:ribosomal protein L40E
MKKYCPSCGKQNPVSAKFCCHCGDSMTLTAKVKQKRNPLKATPPEEMDDYEDDEDENTQITATQLDVEILPTFQGKETIGGIMQASEQTGPVTSDGYKKGGGPKINEEKFLEDFRREAGPLRGDTSVGQ